jgi:hypothetical protein
VSRAEDIYLGKTVALPASTKLNKTRHVFADLEVEWVPGEHTLVDHSTVDGLYRLSVSFAVVQDFRGFDPMDPQMSSDTTDRRIVSMGQTPPEDRVVAVPGVRKISVGDRRFIEQAWADWHLNDMNATCAHMPTFEQITSLAADAGFTDQYGRIDASGWALENVVCSAGSGYRYGRSWLSRIVPADVIGNAMRIIEEQK